MAVARAQLRELIEIIMQELDSEGVIKFRRILLRFQTSEAYRANQSFRETVDRMLAATENE